MGPRKNSKASGKSKKNDEPEKIVVLHHTDSEVDDNGASSGSDEDMDRPFTVEYSPTSRATCRRCDEAIKKDHLRVSHIPLFRGKPGFRIYRHLECAIFSEDITDAKQVGGWKKLKKEDYEALCSRIEENKLELEKENEEIQPDELVQKAFTGEIRKSPPGLSANLLPFQVEGASWMYHQEVKVQELRSGILADEMGMGKTMQTITTILDNRPLLQHAKPDTKHPPSCSESELQRRKREADLWDTAQVEWRDEMLKNEVPGKLLTKKAGDRAGTLVVCPVIALMQWKSEIEKFTEPDSLTVGVYHGPNRASEMPLETMKKYDVILTTYQVMEQDYRKMVSPNKISCPNCGRKFKIDKLKVHLKYFCGETAQRTEAQMRQRRTADREDPPQGGRRKSTGGTKTPGKKTKAVSVTPTPDGKKRRTKKDSSSDSDDSSDDEPLKSFKTAPVKKKAHSQSRSKEDTTDPSSDDDGSNEGPSSSASAKARPSRSATKQTLKKISSSFSEALDSKGSKDISQKVAKAFEGDDDSDFSADEESDDDIDMDSDVVASEESEVDVPTKRKKGKTSKAKSKDEALERARKRQKMAMNDAKKSKKFPEELKKDSSNNNKKKKAKSKAKPKGQAKKKFDDEPSSSESESSEVDSDDDPLDDVDMDALLEEAMAGSRLSPLHSLTWWRVVLDEAHYIKSRSSQTAASAFALTAIHRWCLSGTPLQNRVGELYSLIRFLRLEPMAHYFCRQCDCKSIHYRMKEGRCKDCNHRAFSHYAHFNRYVLNPIQRDGYTGDGRRAMFILKNEVLDKCLLRRTKETRAADMCLPPRIVSIKTIRLHPIEQDFYDSLYTETRASFDDYVTEGTLLNNYAHIFDLLTKMRQAVDHPYLIVFNKKNMKKRGGVTIANGSTVCDLCSETPTERVISTCCSAGYCRACVLEYMETSVGDDLTCPSCERPFTIDLNQESIDIEEKDESLAIPAEEAARYALPTLKELPHVPMGSILRRIDLANFSTSTKIEALVKELIEMRRARPGSKALVFSQFVNMLDLIRWRMHTDPALVDLGLGVRLLHGGMDVKSRNQTLKEFREDPKVRILLMSLKAGGVALNLTVASEVYLVDNWWNPAAEMQAIDRTHRLGQYRPIRAVRFIAEGTVEERVLQLQEKKRLVFDGTVGRDAGSLKMLTVDDMKALFSTM